MSRLLRPGALCAILSFCLCTSAWGNAADDVRAGEGLFLNSVKVLLDSDTHFTGGYDVPKDAGTLDMKLNGLQLGLGVNQEIILNGSANGNIITWTFNKNFNPPIDVGGENSIHHAHGQIVVRASFQAGEDIPQCGFMSCARNILLKEDSDTHVTVEGTGLLGIGWTRDVSLLLLRGAAGIPQPGLAGFYLPASGISCSSASEDVALPISVFLTSAAPSGGTKIDFTSSNPQGVTVTPHLIAPAGKVSVGFNALIRKGFTGWVSLTAASTGVVSSKPIKIHPADDCKRGSGGRDPLRPVAYVSDLLAGCINCMNLIDFNLEEESLIRVQGVDSLMKEGRLTPLSDILGASVPSAVALANNGVVTGLMVPRNGQEQVAFKASLDAGPSHPELLGSFTPTGISSLGVVVGFRTATTGPVAVMHDTLRVRDLPVSARWSQATGVSDTGHVIGLLEGGEGVRGFHLFKGEVRTLPLVALAPAVPVSVNALGQIAANVDDGRGTTVAVFIDASNILHRLETPAGFTSLRATSINDQGWMTLTASNETTQRGFLYTPEDGLLDVTALLDTSAGMQVMEALRVTSQGQLLVRARVGESTGLYLLKR